MRLNSNTKIVGRNVILVPYQKFHVPKYHEWMNSAELRQLTASERLTLEDEYEMQKSWREDEDKCTFIILEKSSFDDKKDEIGAMIGDTNIFMNNKDTAIGEIEIMIAEKSARGKKLGWEAVILMILYGIKFINVNVYEAKIAYTNTISINMFKSLGFNEKSRSDVFQEVTLEKIVSKDWTDWLHKKVSWEIQNYKEIKQI